MPAITNKERSKAKELIRRYDIAQQRFASLDIQSEEELSTKAVELVAQIRKQHADQAFTTVSADTLQRFLNKLHEPSDAVAPRHTSQALWPIYKTLYDKTPCYLDTQARLPIHTALLRSLYLIDQFHPLYGEQQSLSAQLSILDGLRERLDSMPGRIKALFMSEDERAEILDAMSELENSLPELEERVGSFERSLEDARSVTDESIWEDFIARPTHYDSLVQRLSDTSMLSPLPEPSGNVVSDAFQLQDKLQRAHAKLLDIAVPTHAETRTAIGRFGKQVCMEHAESLFNQLDSAELADLGFEITVPLEGDRRLTLLGNLHTCKWGTMAAHKSDPRQQVADDTQRVFEDLLRKVPCAINDDHRTSSQSELLQALYFHTYAASMAYEKRYAEERVTMLAESLEEFMANMLCDAEPYAAFFMDEATRTAILQELTLIEVSYRRLAALIDELEAKSKPTNDRVWSSYYGDQEYADLIIHSIVGSPLTKALPSPTLEIHSRCQQAFVRLKTSEDELDCMSFMPDTMLLAQIEGESLRLRRSYAYEAFDQEPVTVLQRFGINTDQLVDAGCNTLGQIVRNGVPQRICVASPEDAQQITSLTHAVGESLLSKMPCFLDQRMQPSDADTLLINLAILHKNAERRVVHNGIDDVAKNAAQQGTHLSADTAGPMGLFMHSLQERRFAKRVEHFEVLVDIFARRAGELVDLARIPDSEEARRIYADNAERFDSLVHYLTGCPRRTAIPGSTSTLSKSLEELVAQAQAVVDRASSICIPSTEGQRASVEAAIRDVRVLHAKSLCKEIDPDILQLYGVDTEGLAEKGIGSIYDMMDAGDGVLSRAIEEVPPDKVRAILDEVFEAVLQKTPCFLDADVRPPIHTHCVYELVLLEENQTAGIELSRISEESRRLHSVCKSLASYLLEPSDVFIEDAILQGLSRKVEVARIQVAELSRDVESLEQRPRPSIDEAWETYLANQVHFDSVAEALGGGRLSEGLPQVTADLALKGMHLSEREQRLKRRLKNLTPPSFKKQQDIVRARALAVRDEHVLALLSEMRIDELSAVNVDLESITGAGYQTVAELWLVNYGQLRRELGEECAMRARSLASELYHTLFVSMPCLIDVTNPSKSQVQLMAEAVRLDRLPAIRALHAETTAMIKRFAPSYKSPADAYLEQMVMAEREHLQLEARIRRRETMASACQRELEEIAGLSLRVDEESLSQTALDAYLSSKERLDMLIARVTDAPIDTGVPVVTVELARRAASIVDRCRQIQDALDAAMPPSVKQQVQVVREHANEEREKCVSSMMSSLGVEVLDPLLTGNKPYQLKGSRNLGSVYADFEKRNLFSEVEGSYVSGSGGLADVVSMIKTVHDELMRITPCLIDGDTRPDTHTEIVYALMVLFRIPTIRRQREALSTGFRDEVDYRRLVPEPGRHTSNLIMTAEEYASLTREIELLEGSLPKLEQMMWDLIASLTFDTTTAWNDYQKHADLYVRVLNSIADSPAYESLPTKNVQLARAVHETYSQAQDLVEYVTRLKPPSEREQEETVISLANRCRDLLIDGLAAQLDVSCLAPFGVDVNGPGAMRSYTVFDLSQMSLTELTERFGDENGTAAYQAVVAVMRMLFETVPCRPNATAKSALHTRLVESAIVLGQFDDICDDYDRLFMNLAAYSEERETLEGRAGYLGHLFAHEEHRVRLRDAESTVRATMPTLWDQAHTFDSAYNLDASDAWKTYEYDPEAFIHLICQISGLPYALEIPSPCSELAVRGLDAQRRLAQLEQDARDLMPPSEREQRDAVRFMSEAVRHEYVKEMLDKLEIESLAPMGVNAMECRQYGIVTVGQALTTSPAKLVRFLGSHAAKHLSQSAQDVADAVMELTPCIIDGDRRPHTHARLVGALITLKRLPEIVQKREALRRDVESLIPLGRTLEGDPGYMGNLLMASARRSEFAVALDALCAQIPSLEERVQELAGDAVEEKTESASDKEWEEYLENHESFDEVVCVVADSPHGYELPCATEELAFDAIWALQRYGSMTHTLNRSTVPDKDQLMSGLIGLARKIREDHLHTVLAKIPIESLSPVLKPIGVRSETLRFYGYGDLARFVTVNHSDLYEFLSVDETADTINVARMVRQAALRAIPCVIDDDNPTRYQAELVQLLVILDGVERLEQEREALQDELDGCMGDIEVLREHREHSRNLFMARDQKHAFGCALDHLCEALAEIAQRVVVLDYECNHTREYALAVYRADRERLDKLVRTIVYSPAETCLPSDTTEMALEAHGLLQRLEAVCYRLSNLKLERPEGEDEEIERCIDAVRKEETAATMRGYPVSSLSRMGVRVRPLQSAGFQTYGDLLGYDASTIARRAHIDQSEAERIASVIEGTRKSVYAHSRCRIDIDEKPETHSELIRHLYTQLLWERLQNRRTSLQDRGVELSVNSSELRGETYYISNLIMGPRRLHEFGVCLQTLKTELPLLEGAANALKEDAETSHDISLEDVWRDYEKHAADYQVLISELIGGTGSLAYGDLPGRLVDQVAQYPIDLSGLDKDLRLRDYQRFAVRYALMQERTLIGDEMGLGKTIEALAVIAHLIAKKEKHFVVVSPLSVIFNWEHEAKERLPKTNIFNVYGPKKKRELLFKRWCLHGGVAITSYDTVKLLDWGWLKDRVGIIVVDEAHYIKNAETLRSRSISEALLPLSQRTLFLTGTPLENSLDEMNSILSYLNPELVKSFSGETMSNPYEYREAIAPVYLRRKRDDVLVELPPCTVINDWLGLEKEDERDYRLALEEGSFSGMRRVGWRHDSMKSSAKANRLLEIYREAKANGLKVLVFSFFIDTLNKAEALVRDDCVGIISGKVNAKRRQQMVDEFKESDKTVLVAQVTAGGIGLNIQSASVLIFCEPQVKPSIEEQAISRAHRMGQVHKVVVHRLLMERTADEDIENRLEQKREEFRNYADISSIGKESLGVIDPTAVLEIIEEERKRYNIRGGKPVSAAAAARAAQESNQEESSAL